MAIDLPNSSAWIIAHLACIHAGIPQVPLPPFFTPQQRAHALRDAGADLLLGPKDRSAITVPVGRQHVSAHRLANPAIALPKGTALVTYTSGSTGAPKGVCLSQSGMEQVATSLIQVLGNEVAQRHLSVLPLGVLLEQVGGLYACLFAGGTYVIREGEALSEALLQSRATSCILVPEMLKSLINASTQKNIRFEDLRFAAVGGARVPDALLEQAEAIGLPVYQGYGLSESASVVAVNVPGRNKRGTVGQVLPHIPIRSVPMARSSALTAILVYQWVACMAVSPGTGCVDPGFYLRAEKTLSRFAHCSDCGTFWPALPVS